VRKDLAAAVLGLSLACAGCSSGSEQDVTATAERFQQALANDDGARACAQLTPATRKALAEDEKKSCSKAVLDLGLDPGGEVRGAKVYLTSSYVQVGDKAAFLDETPSGWRISAAGCSPTGDDMPFDCEVED
jgi:hypothetical protein